MSDDLERICSTCAYWTAGASHDERIHPYDPETYEPMVMPFAVRWCKSPKLQKFDRPILSDRASVCDGSNYAASLLTGPNFGCVHWRSCLE